MSSWPNAAPVKPELTFKSGNRALSPNSTDLISGLESPSALATNNDFVADPLTPFCGTCPAAAEAARMGYDHGGASRLLARVHSAPWTLPRRRQSWPEGTHRTVRQNAASATLPRSPFCAASIRTRLLAFDQLTLLVKESDGRGLSIGRARSEPCRKN